MAVSAAYISSQQNRYKQAIQNNDQDLMKRLEQDAVRANYALPKPSTPAQKPVSMASSMGANLTKSILNNVPSMAIPAKPANSIADMATNIYKQSIAEQPPKPTVAPVQQQSIPKPQETKSALPAMVSDQMKEMAKQVVQNAMNNVKANIDTQNTNYPSTVASVLKPANDTVSSPVLPAKDQVVEGVVNQSQNNVLPIKKDDPNWIKNEKQRTQDVIMDRLASGQDIKEQEAYFAKLDGWENQLNPSTPVSNTVQNKPATETSITTPVSNNTNNNNTSSNQFTYNPEQDAIFKALKSTPAYQDKVPFQQLETTPFNYDVTNDPIYQNALKNALANAELSSKRASKGVLETMNERGILNSSLTANQLAEITNQYLQQANNDIQSNLVPQLLNQSYSRYRDNVSDQQFNLQRSDQQRNQDYQRYLDSIDQAQKQAQIGLQSRNQQFGEFQAGQDQNARNRQLAMQEAGLTGNYNGQQTIESRLSERDYQATQKQRTFDNALNQSQALGYVTPAMSKLTGIKAGTKLADTIYKQGLIDNAATKNENTATYNEVKSQIDKMNAETKATNAQTSKERAKAYIEKNSASIESKSNQKGMSLNQQQTFVDKAIKPILDKEFTKDDYGFDQATGKYILLPDSQARFIDVMKSVYDTGKFDNDILKMAFKQYGVTVPSDFFLPQSMFK